MTKVVECECGFQARSEDEDELVRLIQAHSRDVHDMEMTRDQVLAIARPA